MCYNTNMEPKGTDGRDILDILQAGPAVTPAQGDGLTFSEDELIQALLQAAASDGDRPAGAMTRQQIQDALTDQTGRPWSERRVIRWLKDLKRDGRIEVVQIPDERLDGLPCTKPGYRLLEGRGNG